MNIYEKLQAVRVDLAAEGLQKGKTNTYSNYTYFELSDFLPQINKLCQKHKLGHHTTVADDGKMMVLTLHDSEKPDSQIDFKIPMSTAQLKASHPVQNLGAVLTYSRRYLYMMAFDIVQGDVLEQITGKSDTVDNTKKFTFNHEAAPMDELCRLWEFVGWDTKGLLDYVNNRAAAMQKEVTKETITAIVLDNIAYLKNEAQKGNNAYKNMIFDEGVPF